MKPLPTGQLFTDCGCCGRRFGGTSTDPFKLCRLCLRKECSIFTRTPKCER